MPVEFSNPEEVIFQRVAGILDGGADAAAIPRTPTLSRPPVREIYFLPHCAARIHLNVDEVNSMPPNSVAEGFQET